MKHQVDRQATAADMQSLKCLLICEKQIKNNHNDNLLVILITNQVIFSQLKKHTGYILITLYNVFDILYLTFIFKIKMIYQISFVNLII